MSITIIVLLVACLHVFVQGAFPIKKLTNASFSVLRPKNVHAYTGDDVILTAITLRCVKDLGLHPQVLLASDIDSTDIVVLIVRANRVTGIASWARAVKSSYGDYGSCIDESGNIYMSTYVYPFRNRLSHVGKYSPDGAIIWEKRFATTVLSNAIPDADNIASTSNGLLFLPSYATGRFSFFFVNASNGKPHSVVPVEQKKAPERVEFGGSVEDTACIFSYSQPTERGIYFHIHCIQSNENAIVKSRLLKTMSYTEATRRDPMMSFEPAVYGSACASIYVLYRSDLGTPTGRDYGMDQTIIRKLSACTLKDVPWSGSGWPQRKYVRLETGQFQIYPRAFFYVAKLKGVAFLFDAREFESTGKVRMDRNNATLLGYQSQYSTSGALWLFFYGKKRKPAVVPVPVSKNKDKGYLADNKPYDYILYANVDVSQDGEKAIVYGRLSKTRNEALDKLYTFDVDIPLL